MKEKILVQNGIISEEEIQKKPSVLTCGRCNYVNPHIEYCSKCSYPLTYAAFDAIKKAEEIKLQALQDKYENDMELMRDEMHRNFSQIISMIQQNQLLKNIKPEALSNKVVEKSRLSRGQE